MRMMRYKAQDDGQGARCGTYTVGLMHEGRKWARVLYIEAQELSLVKVPIDDVDKWMTPLPQWTDKQALKFFRYRARTFGATKAVKKLLYPK